MPTFDEEREEDRITALPQHIRDDFQPDGMSAPPDVAPRQAGGAETGRFPDYYRETERLRRRLEGICGLLEDIRKVIRLEHISLRPESARLWAELAGRIESVLARKETL